ncbi:ABC transporter permease subunit [Microvirga tunisiensis]|jgi:multiple sugar transport system permease protein|uniref:ABC transporter permease subunit n=2 Tax=Pannonibacter tanglangensis TaxID=2750084 RepID=A0ABW9ZJF2_9HYPH|nr:MULTISPECIES: carbohydrate ABC transporter permease [Pannonibacter]NBN63194.1 ABC transporter permease subunit [Pannonibacter sp. XCT-34]NBN76758.1 ABC transporter permease subunit [Pannonibacter sp. XCT-53]
MAEPNATRSLTADLPRLALLGLAAFIALAPYLWMISVSMKPQSEVFAASLDLIPNELALIENYGKVLERVPVGTYILNGLIVCFGILVFQILFAVPAAYALAKLNFPGRDIVFGFVMLGLLVPYQTTALPLYIGFATTGLLDTYTALIAPFVCSVFAIFLFRQFFRALPDDLINAARIDGMGEFSIVWRVILPNAWPAATAFAIFSVVAHWNDLFWPLVVVQKGDLYTPAMGILAFRSVEAGEDYGALMAAALLVTAPLVIAFLFAQRRFIEGITMTGLKG